MEIKFAKHPGCSLFLDITDHKYGKLTVLGYAGLMYNNNARGWWCECECGSVRKYALGNLRGGGSTQCFVCAKRSFKNYKHGLSCTKLYRTWFNRNQELCKEWKESVQAFCDFMSKNTEQRKGSQLNAIDPSKPIGPDNYIWSKGKGTGRGRIFYEHNGERMSLSAWARRLKISAEGLRMRLKTQSPEVALSYTNKHKRAVV